MAINEFVKETVVGILYGIFMWGTRFTSPPYISRRSRRRPSSLHGGGGVDDEKGYHGIGIALDPPPEVKNPGINDDDEKKTRLILKSCMAPAPAGAKKSSPTSFFTLMPSELSYLWTKSTTGDFLGTESGVHMVSAAAVVAPPWGNPNPSLDKTTTTCRRVKVKQEMKRWDIPPPLTWLQRRRRDYNNPGDYHHHPYSLNREYINGRLVIKEMEVEDFVEIENVQDNCGEDTRHRRLHIDLVVGEDDDDDQENSFLAAADDDI